MRARTALWAASAAVIVSAMAVGATGHTHPPVPFKTGPIQSVEAAAPWSATTQAAMAHYVAPRGIRVKEPAARFAASIFPPSTTTTAATTTTTAAPTTTTAAYDPAATGMGAPGSFQACVAWRESSDGQASSDVYGILPYIWSDVIGFAGSPYYASLATQDAAFWKLYDMDGTSPWAPYDGC